MSVEDLVDAVKVRDSLITYYKGALQSIAKSNCCSKCRQMALDALEQGNRKENPGFGKTPDEFSEYVQVNFGQRIREGWITWELWRVLLDEYPDVVSFEQLERAGYGQAMVDLPGNMRGSVKMLLWFMNRSLNNTPYTLENVWGIGYRLTTNETS